MSCSVTGCRNEAEGLPVPSPVPACKHPAITREQPGNLVRCLGCDATWTDGDPPPSIDNLLRVKATPATDFEPGARAVALVDLCAQHRAEFERLGWLERAEDDEE